MRSVIFVAAVCAACGDDGGSMQRDAAGPGDVLTDGPTALADIHYIGRFDAMKRFAWPGSQIRTRFDGTTISADLEASGNDFFDITVDGTTTVLHPASGRHVVMLANNLASGPHDLALMKRTETFFGTATFHGFSGAPLVETPAPTRLIEFIGDSITCGYGVLGGSATCQFTADTEAETHAWAAFAAPALGAAHVSIAYSGVGMYRNVSGGTTDTMPTRYIRTLGDDGASTWDGSYTPDVIVIALGTNDFAQGDPGTQFVTAYTSFVGMLRMRFPAAHILLATSPMLGGTKHTAHRAYLDQVVTMTADSKVAVVEVAEQLAGDGFGCDYHPNEVTQRKMADQVVPAIRAAAGW